MSPHLLAKMRAKGNGYTVGEVTGPGVMRWHEYLCVRLGGAR